MIVPVDHDRRARSDPSRAGAIVVAKIAFHSLSTMLSKTAMSHG
jgi:hypothetical protein